MIAKGNLHAHGAKLAAYLTTSSEEERAELVELRGFVADNIRDAFIDVQIQAEATRATKPFFHAYVRLPEGEALTRVHWQDVADRLEQKLGFTDQPRAVAFHHGADGETHMHIAWSRIDLETMRAIDPGLYKNKMKELCRELERELDLTKVSNVRGPDDRTRSAGRDEFEQARRLGTDLKDIRNTIHDCWQHADTGKAFAAALEQHGLILARGDRRPWVIVDREGGDHVLSKRITGATAAETRARMTDIDRTRLPSVAEARATQLERLSRTPTPEIGRQQNPQRDHERAHAASDPRMESNAAPTIRGRAGDITGRASIKVMDGAAQVVGKLADIAADILSLGATATKEPSRHPQLEALERIEAQERASVALDRMSESLQRGDGIRREDLGNLTRDHLMHLQATGDDGLRAMIKQHEEDRERVHDRSYGLER